MLDMAAIEAIEAERKQLCRSQTQELQNLRNTRSKAIGMAKGRARTRRALLAEVAGIGDQLKANEHALADVQAKLADIALGIPNLPDAVGAAGTDESRTSTVSRWGTPRAFDFAVKDHVELGEHNGWLDGDAGSKLSGARFTVLRGELAHLHRALAQFMLDLHTSEHGYLECNVPLIVNADSDAGHRPAAEVRGGPVRHRNRRDKALSDPDRGSPVDQHRARRPSRTPTRCRCA